MFINQVISSSLRSMKDGTQSQKLRTITGKPMTVHYVKPNESKSVQAATLFDLKRKHDLPEGKLFIPFGIKNNFMNYLMPIELLLSIKSKWAQSRILLVEHLIPPCPLFVCVCVFFLFLMLILV